MSQWVSPWLKGKAENRKWVASTDDRKKKKQKTNHNHINETEQNRTEQIDINIYIIYIYIKTKKLLQFIIIFIIINNFK
mgnify:FL=1